jgi:putative flippase GtrA
MLNRKNISQMMIFFLGGGLGALVNLIMTALLTEVAGWHYMKSYAVGVAANIIFNFLYHKEITFKVDSQWQRRLPKFVVTSAFVGGGIYLLIYLQTTFLGWWYLLAGVISIGIMSAISFSVNKRWVFKK